MVDDQTKLELYRLMTLGRAVEDKLYSLYRQGRLLGAIYLGRGQEATEVGAAAALKDGDTLAPTHRDLIAQIAHGLDIHRIFMNHFGRADGPTRGRDGNTHAGDMSKGILYNISMLPDGYPVSTGIALSFKLRKQPQVAMAYCGEGATSRGDWHEALNFASIKQLPVVFIVTNNKFAYSSPNEVEMVVDSVTTRAPGYAMKSATVDGNDVIAVYEAATEAVERARGGGGPTLIEANTMRMLGHAGHDPADYVPEELLKEWEEKDPIKAYKQRLLDESVLDESKIAAIDEEHKAAVEEAVTVAEAAPLPDGSEVSDGVYH